MDVGYTYGGSDWSRISLYAPPNMEPPEEITMTDPETGRQRQYVRLSDRTLLCRKWASDGITREGCGSYECHRGERLGHCSCGAHSDEAAKPQRAEPGETTYTEPPTKKEMAAVLGRKHVPSVQSV